MIITQSSLLEACIAIPFEIYLPGHPPTANHMWRRGRHGIYKTKEASSYESLVGILVRQRAHKLYGTSRLDEMSGSPLKLEIAILRSTWMGKTKATAQKFVRPDLDNFIKPLIDSVTRSLGLEDSGVVEIVGRKEFSGGKDETFFRMEFLREWRGSGKGRLVSRNG